MSDIEMRVENSVAFEGVTPVLRVQSISASIEYYVNKLGFKLDWEYSDFFASVSRGRCHLFLCEGDQGNFGTWVWIGVAAAEALFGEYRAKGARVRHPPTNYDWALEMQVEDLDGNVLRMGSDPKTGEPIGEWLDMHGQRWARYPGNIAHYDRPVPEHEVTPRRHRRSSEVISNAFAAPRYPDRQPPGQTALRRQRCLIDPPGGSGGN